LLLSLFTADFHSRRQELVDDFFAFHPAMIKYAEEKYFSGFAGSRETVSVHFRFVTAAEPVPGGVTSRPQATASWYLHLMQNEFEPAKVVFFVFSEDSRVVMPLFMNAQARIPALQFVIVEEDFATSLVIMSMCKHHFVPDSTFSYWGTLMFPLLTDNNVHDRRVSRQEARRQIFDFTYL
jgi:hypothetical protein